MNYSQGGEFELDYEKSECPACQNADFEVWTQVILTCKYPSYSLSLAWPIPQLLAFFGLWFQCDTARVLRLLHQKAVYSSTSTFDETFKAVQMSRLTERWVSSIYSARMEMIDIVQVIEWSRSCYPYFQEFLLNVWCGSVRTRLSSGQRFEHKYFIMIWKEHRKKKKSPSWQPNKPLQNDPGK